MTKGGERCGDVDVKQEKGAGYGLGGSGEFGGCDLQKIPRKSKFGPNFFAVERFGDRGQPITLQRSGLLSSRWTRPCPRNAGIHAEIYVRIKRQPEKSSDFGLKCASIDLKQCI